MAALTGLGLWVWNWQDSYITIAQRIGASFMLIKAADGVSPWAQWPDAASKTSNAGILPVPWSYNYGDPAEPAALVNAAPGSGIYVLNAETEYEQLSLADQQLFWQAIQQVRNQCVIIGNAGFARPEVHQGYNYSGFAQVLDLWLPEVAWPYWTPADYNYWFQWWDKFNLGSTVPWLPTYLNDQGVSMDPSVLVASVAAAKQRYGAVTIWAAHTITEAQIIALEAANVVPPPPPPPPPIQPPETSGAALLLGGLALLASAIILYREYGGQQ